MKTVKDYSVKNKNTIRNIFVTCVCLTGLLCTVLGPLPRHTSRDYYQIMVDGTVYGVYESQEQAREAVVDARIQANAQKQQMVLSDFDYTIQTISNVRPMETNPKSAVDELCEVMLENEISESVSCYVMKINSYTVTLGSKEEVTAVLNKILDLYDVNQEYEVILTEQKAAEHPAMSAQIVQTAEQKTSGIESIIFSDEVDVAQTFAAPDEIMSVEDTVSAITEGSRLKVRVDQQMSYTEEYIPETVYVENEDWYTTKKEVVNEGTTGVHNVTALVTYQNGAEINRQILSDEVVTEAQARVIEVGTQEQPTYIKPLKGGSYSSGFGTRWGRLHKGVDWSCSIGTTIFASCSGKVITAGWVNGYGNCIVLSHSDGKQTRYAHLSEIQVRVGQKVQQGETIALSGNTGNSTGPHLHFEIMEDGVPVDPMQYLQ